MKKFFFLTLLCSSICTAFARDPFTATTTNNPLDRRVDLMELLQAHKPSENIHTQHDRALSDQQDQESDEVTDEEMLNIIKTARSHQAPYVGHDIDRSFFNFLSEQEEKDTPSTISEKRRTKLKHFAQTIVVDVIDGNKKLHDACKPVIPYVKPIEHADLLRLIQGWLYKAQKEFVQIQESMPNQEDTDVLLLGNLTPQQRKYLKRITLTLNDIQINQYSLAGGQQTPLYEFIEQYPEAANGFLATAGVSICYNLWHIWSHFRPGY